MNEVSVLPTIEHFRELYNKADSFARKVALANLEAEIPVHNELRYAGHHFLKSLDDQGNIRHAEELRRAIAHCERAMYEAAETGIVAILDELKNFETEYRGIVIGKIIPNIRETRALRDQAIQLISQPRPQSREVFRVTSEYMHIFEGLRQGVHHLHQNRHDLDAALNIRREKEDERYRKEMIQYRQQINEKWKDRIFVGLAILGILFTIYFGVQ